MTNPLSLLPSGLAIQDETAPPAAAAGVSFSEASESEQEAATPAAPGAQSAGATTERPRYPGGERADAAFIARAVMATAPRVSGPTKWFVRSRLGARAQGPQAKGRLSCHIGPTRSGLCLASGFDLHCGCLRTGAWRCGERPWVLFLAGRRELLRNSVWHLDCSKAVIVLHDQLLVLSDTNSAILQLCCGVPLLEGQYRYWLSSNFP